MTRKNKKTYKKTLYRRLINQARHYFKMVFVPHRRNGYRPHLVRGYGLAAIVFVIVGLQLGYNISQTGDVLGREADITVTALLEQTNKVRYLDGQPELVLNDKLTEAAYLKATDMFEKQYWSHDAPDGTEPWKWLGDVGYKYAEAGENLARGFTTAEGVLTAWINSPSHKANILKSSYHDVGFAVVDGIMDSKYTTIVVALYGLSTSSLIADQQASFVGNVASGDINIFTQFAVASRSATPALIAGLILTLLVVIVSLVAHMNRHKLPKIIRNSWKHHHGLYKAIAMLVFGVITLYIYGAGQI